jgi:hypothetical protein
MTIALYDQRAIKVSRRSLPPLTTWPSFYNGRFTCRRLRVGTAPIARPLTNAIFKTFRRPDCFAEIGTKTGTELIDRKKRFPNSAFELTLAEREGFEPPIPLRVCRISSAVLSTTQPPLQAIERSQYSALDVIAEKPICYPFATQSPWRDCLLRRQAPGQRMQHRLYDWHALLITPNQTINSIVASTPQSSCPSKHDWCNRL